ncbi:replication initiator [Microbacterium sp. 69-7]|uniref:replication initiator n=1 Tax=Microbacterium sp. 69-7 TaxID=1895784 RepID=UPI000A79078B
MRLDESVSRRLRSEDYDRWMHNVASTGYCHNPVRLVGASTTFHEATGEVLSEYSSASEPDGITFTRCGNRRATRCESCSHEYKGDTWHMIMAGAAGGMKEVPEEVAEHPMAFLTLTAPSFGAVHTTAIDRRSGTCEHGNPRGCRCHHDDDDPRRGDAVCAECYDYVGHVVWQYHAPELWRRFTIGLRRELARSLGLTQRAAARLVRVQFAKVAEFQRRGVVHFHAIIRLDGIDPERPFPAPPAGVTAVHLMAAIQAAARKTQVTAGPLPGDDGGRTLTWGKQFDVRPIVRREGLDGALSDRAVAAYIAKYATKATEDLEPTGVGRDHIRSIKATVRELAAVVHSEGPYEQLHRWDGMLGFRGHFSTKSRRYSVTLGSLRGARRTWRMKHLLAKSKPAEEISTDEVLVIGSWAYAGMGWLTDGDKALAREAADAARQWRQQRARDRNTSPYERSTS